MELTARGIVEQLVVNKQIAEITVRIEIFIFLENTEVSHRDRERQPDTNQPTNQP